MSTQPVKLQAVRVPNHQEEVIAELEGLLADARAGKITGLAGIAHYGPDQTAKFGTGTATALPNRTLSDLSALARKLRGE